MSRFHPYSPDQAYLLPPNARDVLGEDHLVLTEFEEPYCEEGGGLYAPALMLKMWLYAYALGVNVGAAVGAEDMGRPGISLFGGWRNSR